MEENGVWRTVGGRRIFIKDGQDLASAMKESGKFSSRKLSKEEKARQWVLTKKEIDELEEKLRKKQLSQEEHEKTIKRIKTLKEEKKELSKDLTEEDYRNAKSKMREEETQKMLSDINKKENEEGKIYNKLIEDTNENLEKELRNTLSNIEKYEEEYGIDEQIINEKPNNIIKKINEMHENGEISDYVYENYLDNYYEKISNVMSEKGYETYTHQGKTYYSMLPKAKEAYNNILEELDKKGVDYEISKSWNAGELPSIYIENKNGDTFRIANHFNNKNQQFEAYSLEANKIYSTKDYINYKETVIKDLENWLKENK